MRELTFVKKIKFDFNGSIAKQALVIGDADNDGRNELVCANLQGELAILKGRERFASADGLGMITACAIGDVFNLRRNFVITINMEGWLFVFDATHVEIRCPNRYAKASEETIDISNNDKFNSSPNAAPSTPTIEPIKLEIFYEQRMPANCKELLLADLDGDGQIELIIGLTDRVLRTYKWINIGNDRGKFVGLYKWEFADQIGSVSLNPSRRENCLDIIVAQPGGTYARLECFDKKPLFDSNSRMSSSGSESQDNDKRYTASSSDNQPKIPKQLDHLQTGDASGDNVKTEFISKLTPEYHQLALAQMRNHHISTVILGGLRNSKNSDSYSCLVTATLDGTLMLVDKDEILWSLQVDHQLFALAVIEQESEPKIPSTLPQSTYTIAPSQESSGSRPASTPESIKHANDDEAPTSRQYFVASAWDGKTYIVDEERNYLRFKFEEAVSAFTAGCYYYDDRHQPALVYATFNNQIVLYYDVIPEDIRPKFLIDELISNPEHVDLREKLEFLHEKLGYHDEANQCGGHDKLYDLVYDILYGFPRGELPNELKITE